MQVYQSRGGSLEEAEIGLSSCLLFILKSFIFNLSWGSRSPRQASPKVRGAHQDAQH